MALQTNCDTNRKSSMADYAKSLAGKYTYNSKSAALAAVGLSSLDNLLSRGKQLNCGQFIAKVMIESGPQMAAGLANQPIPNDFIDQVDNLFTPSYATTLS